MAEVITDGVKLNRLRQKIEDLIQDYGCSVDYRQDCVKLAKTNYDYGFHKGACFVTKQHRAHLQSILSDLLNAV